MILALLPAVRDWLGQSGFRRDATVLFTSTALARMVLVLSMPVVARFFAPDDVGSWQVFVSAATVIGVIVCWRYELAIPLPAEDEKARDLVRLSMLVAVGMSGLCALAILLARSHVVRWIATPALAPYVWCIPPFVLLIGCEQAATYWLTRTGDFTSQGLSRLLKSLFSVGLPLALVSTVAPSASLLIVGTLLGQVGATAYMLRRNMWRSDGQGESMGFSLTRLRRALLEYKSYPLYVAPYAFISQFAKRLVYFLLASFATSDVVGFFAMAMQITLVPVTFISSALNQAFYKRASATPDLCSLELLVRKVLRLQVLLALPAFMIVMLHAEYILSYLLGERWQGAAGYVAWLTVPSMMLFLTSWLDRVYDASGRQRLAVVLQLCYDAVSLSLFTSLLIGGSPPLMAVGAYALTTALYNAIWLAITFRVAGFSLAPLLELALLGGLLIGLVAGVHWSLHRLDEPLALTLEVVLTIVSQALAYGASRKLRR